MINKFIYETDLSLDMDKLRKLVDEDEHQQMAYAHHRLVANNEYLSSIKNQLPFLSPVYNIYRFESGRVVRTHIDGDRYCTLNIPVYNTENSHTIFYENSDSYETEYDEKRILYYIKNPPEESFRFTLTKPTLVNTTYPHGVLNEGDKTRVIISWSILKPMKFEDCYNKLRGIQICQ